MTFTKERLVQLLPAAPGNVDIGSFRDEPLRTRQPDATVRAGDDGDLSFKSAHGVLNA